MYVCVCACVYLSLCVNVSASTYLSSANGATDPFSGCVPRKVPSLSSIRACFGPSQSMSIQSYIGLAFSIQHSTV